MQQRRDQAVMAGQRQHHARHADQPGGKNRLREPGRMLFQIENVHHKA